jgi:hypothetical protein
MRQRPESTEQNVPKLIVWQLADAAGASFTLHESLLTIESIAALSRPIVVLTGPRLLGRYDLFQIVEYGFALGLKMIVEAEPEELNDTILGLYGRFGKRVFRVIVDGRVQEDPARRFRDTPELRALDACIANLRRHGYEIHLSLTVKDTDRRKVSHVHDYALQRDARGLFCHIDLADGQGAEEVRPGEIDLLLGRISSIKNSIGGPMYFSPQCVTYRLLSPTPQGGPFRGPRPVSRDDSWFITCAAGRSYAMITADGQVRLCRNVPEACGDLRASNYDFAGIWYTASAFLLLRGEDVQCGSVRKELARPRRDVAPLAAAPQSDKAAG